jgi:hypothetical protein
MGACGETCRLQTRSRSGTRGSFQEPLQDHFANAFDVGENIIIPEAEDLKAVPMQKGVAGDVRRGTRVLSTIDLDRKPQLHAGEIDDIRSDRMLAADFGRGELPAAQAPPQQALGIGHVAAQAPGCPYFLALAHPCAPDVRFHQIGETKHSREQPTCAGAHQEMPQSACPHPSLPPPAGEGGHPRAV